MKATETLHLAPEPRAKPYDSIPAYPRYIHDLQAATYLSHEAATNNTPLTPAEQSLARRACIYVAYGDQKDSLPFTSVQVSTHQEGKILEHVAGIIRLKNLYRPDGTPRSPISKEERDETHRAAIIEMMSLSRITY